MECNFQVVVGNIGTVYSGNQLRVALETYRDYRKLSKEERGRAGGEPVTLFHNNEIMREYIPEVGREVEVCSTS
jgi:hypothetical protein